MSTISVLFVCLGNICRSPTAHGVFQFMVDKQALGHKINVDSAGTGDWHLGRGPDTRALQHAAQRGYDMNDLRASWSQLRIFTNLIIFWPWIGKILIISGPFNHKIQTVILGFFLILVRIQSFLSIKRFPTLIMVVIVVLTWFWIWLRMHLSGYWSILSRTYELAIYTD